MGAEAINKAINNIVLLEMNHLEAEGIYPENLQTALEIECFNKAFSRTSVLAKRYEEKAINICQEYLHSGYDAFITDNGSFLSVWKEKKLTATPFSSQDKKPVINIIKVKQDELDELLENDDSFHFLSGNKYEDNQQTWDTQEREGATRKQSQFLFSDDAYNSYKVKSRLISSDIKNFQECLEKDLPLPEESSGGNPKSNWWRAYVS